MVVVRTTTGFFSIMYFKPGLLLRLGGGLVFLATLALSLFGKVAVPDPNIRCSLSVIAKNPEPVILDMCPKASPLLDLGYYWTTLVIKASAALFGLERFREPEYGLFKCLFSPPKVAKLDYMTVLGM